MFFFSSRRRHTRCALVTGSSDVCSSDLAGNVVTDVAAAVDPAEIYLIYLHGRIVEDRGPRPTGAPFGLYDYQAILDAHSHRDATAIPAQRRPDTDVDTYAGNAISQGQR